MTRTGRVCDHNSIQQMDNETWLLERGGEVIEKMASSGEGSLNAREKLVYCLWVADYGMRNAGDLDTAGDVYEKFLSEGKTDRINK